MFFALPNCVDKGEPSCGLFPETLRSELREVRSVIEAHSNKTKVPPGGNANGIAFGGSNPIRLRVTTVGGTAEYIVDRFD